MNEKPTFEDLVGTDDVQEWTNNVLKYSDADLITVQVGRYNDELSLIIEDNGIGFDSNLLKEGQGNG